MGLLRPRQELAQGPLFLALSPLFLGALRSPQDTTEGVLTQESEDLESCLSSTRASLCDLGQVTHPL